MLHRADSLYHSGRSDDLLKLKPWQDAEATVIEILPGKGKFSGMMGALVVKDKRGHIFRIGSGFSDNERRNPPSLVQSLPINSQVPQKKGCHVLPVF
jgi:DNA ligase-1